jgi:hypothetical protein
MAPSNPALAIQTHFATLEDPRIDRTRYHDLMDIVVIAICAVICGCEGWMDIAKYGRSKYDWLKTFLTPRYTHLQVQGKSSLTAQHLQQELVIPSALQALPANAALATMFL